MLCLIIPLGAAPGSPTHPIYLPEAPPPGYWGGVAPPTVTHPIAPGGAPPGYWGGVAPPGVSHPIAPGGPPPGFWGGVAPPYPSHPIAPGGAPSYPSHPIVIPPGSGEHPTHPIYVPSPTPPAGQEGYYLAYIPALGKWVYIPVGTTKPPETPEPAPKA
jgi:hypothetical protein